MRFVVVGQVAGPVVGPGDLQEAEAHQPGAERDRQVDEPHRRFEVVRLLAGLEHLADERHAEGGDHAGEQRAAQQREQDHLLARVLRQAVDEQVDADMDAGAHAIGGAELRHPDEHVDAEFLRPGQVERGKPQIDALEELRQHRNAMRGRPFRQIDRQTGAVAMHHRDEDQAGRGGDQDRDQPLLEVIERAQHHVLPGQHNGPGAVRLPVRCGRAGADFAQFIST